MIRAYISDFYETHLAKLDLSGVRVLEVGCGYAQLMQMVVDQHPEIKELIGINYPNREVADLSEHARVMVMDATKMDFATDSFDLVYSLATFEHIHDFRGALREIQRVLKPGGRLIAKWSPIWSGFDGHHYGRTRSDPSHHGIELPWAHLIFDPDSLPGYLVNGEGFTLEEAQRATKAIYESDWLSRLGVQEYEEHVNASGLEIERLDAVECELGGLMGRVGAKVSDGSLEPERVIKFFGSTDPHSIMSYKIIAYLRKKSG